jgi:hypothetical protein
MGKGQIHTNFGWEKLRPKKKQRVRPRRRWEDAFAVDRQEYDAGMNSIDLAQDRDSCLALVIASLNFRFPGDMGKFLISRGVINFWRRALLHTVRQSVIRMVGWLVVWLVGWLVGWLVVGTSK